MPEHRSRQYKILLFDTALRNPGRIKQFLSILAKYESLVANNTVACLIAKDILRNKFYKPTIINTNPVYKRIYNSPTETFSDEQLDDIMLMNPQDHTEGGYEHGWASRFFTWFKFARSLGLAYFDVDKPIEISKTGKMLIKAFEDDDPILENSVFINAMARYHRSNPFIMDANTNRPFSLFVVVLLLLKEKTKNPAEGVYRFEIPYFLCWRDNNAEALADFILEQRRLLGLSPSDESVYDNVKKILDIDETKENLYKDTNALGEMPDDYIRKLRLTGIITLRGGGKYLDLDSQFIDKAEYIRDNYFEFKTFDNEYEYYKYAGEWDERLADFPKYVDVDQDVYMSKFEHQVSLYSLETLRNELLILKKSRPNSSHVLFRFMDAARRLEFLTALIIKKTYPSLYVHPNYPIDDEGLPRKTAGGDVADINCRDGNMYINVEVTMLTSTEQNIKETPPVLTHLLREIRDTHNAFAIFIAPKIHDQTRLYMGLASLDPTYSECKIVQNTIEEFSNNLQVKNSLKDFKE